MAAGLMPHFYKQKLDVSEQVPWELDIFPYSGHDPHALFLHIKTILISFGVNLVNEP